MIRRVLLGVFLIYFAIWMFCSYLIESKLKESLDKYKDLSIQYSKIKTTGFPNKWEFEIVSPIIKSNDGNSIFETENITLKISMNFKKFTLSMSNVGTISLLPEGVSVPNVYDIVFNESPNIIIKLKNLDFKDSNIVNNLNNIIITSSSMMISKDNIGVMEIQNNISSISKIKDYNFKLECDVSGDANFDIMGFNKLSVYLLTEFSFLSQNNSIILHALKSKAFEVKIDDDATLDLSGGMEFCPDKIPDGTLILNLYNYNKLVDILWPSYFGIPDEDLKSIIEKCNVNDSDGDAYLPIEFSEEGLNIGQETWQTLRGE